MAKEQATAEKKGFFNTIYDGTKEEIKKVKKPIVEKKLRGKFESAYNDCESKIVDAEFTIRSKMEAGVDDVEKIDINEILKQKAIIRTLKVQKEDLKEIFVEMFGEEPKF